MVQISIMVYWGLFYPYLIHLLDGRSYMKGPFDTTVVPCAPWAAFLARFQSDLSSISDEIRMLQVRVQIH